MFSQKDGIIWVEDEWTKFLLQILQLSVCFASIVNAIHYKTNGLESHMILVSMLNITFILL